MFIRAALLAIAVLAASPAQAQSRAMVEPTWLIPVQNHNQQQRQAVLPLREIVAMVQARFGGRLLNASLEQRGDRPMYRLQWEMPNGDRRDFTVDATTGQIR